MANSLTERLAALTRDYIRQLSDRVSELTQAYRSFLANPTSSGAAESLHLHAHKIAGSGATFGFDGITDAGRDLEAVMNDTLARNSPPDGYAMDAVRAKFEALTTICLEESRAAGNVFDIVINDFVEPSVDGSEIRRMALAYYEESDEIRKLSDQLEIFGYRSTCAKTLDELHRFARENPAGIAIIHTDFVSQCPDGPDNLKAVKRSSAHPFHFVFVSERTDFTSRLSALRSGGEAYFLMPLDTTRLLEKVESLTGRTAHEPYHVLIVDDDPEQVSYYALILQRAGMITSVASDPKTVLDLLSESKPELILMDVYMPGCTGSELLSIIRQQEAFVDVPILFLSVDNDRNNQIQLIRHGGDGFLAKPAEPEYLVATIESHLARTRAIRYFMERDSLTGLLNHTNLLEQLARELMRSKRTNTALSLAMIDLDHFKSVNDIHGHPTGDKVLKSLSRILQERLRRTDIIGRYGGEEFGVVLINTDETTAVQIIDEIRSNFEKLVQQGENGVFHVTFSGGVAGYPAFGEVDALTNAADAALYVAKRAGRNRVVSDSSALT